MTFKFSKSLIFSKNMDCGICASIIARKTSRVVCPSCEFLACKTCMKMFFGSLPEPKCANCNIVWTREFISSSFPSFERDYLMMRQNYLLNRELAMLPETQPIVEREIFVRKLELQARVNPETIEIAKSARFEFEQSLLQTINNVDPVSAMCPSDDCRGYISIETGKCGLCRNMVCKACSLPIFIPRTIFIYECEECHQEFTVISHLDLKDICPKCETGKDDNVPFHKHICKAEDIETAKLIRQETRPCPNCSALIYKIDGCDQMWCVKCKTAFSWTSGRIETGRVHNPHFYEWQRQTADGDEIPRVVEEDACHVFYHQVAYACDPASHLLRSIIQPFHFLITDVIPSFYRAPITPNNLDLRIAYLMNELSKSKFASAVQRRDKKYQKDLEIFELLEEMKNAAHKIFRDIATSASKKKPLLSEKPPLLSDDDLKFYTRELERLRAFTNEHLITIGKKFKVKVKVIIVLKNFYAEDSVVDRFIPPMLQIPKDFYSTVSKLEYWLDFEKEKILEEDIMKDIVEDIVEV